MDIEGKHALVLGGHGLVGMAVCRRLLACRPASLTVASRSPDNARRAADELRAEHATGSTEFFAASGDVFLRQAWQANGDGRAAALADPERRRRLIADILDPLDEDIFRTSTLSSMILGTAPGLSGSPAEIVVDCINTATAVSYQDVYALARAAADAAAQDRPDTDWAGVLEPFICALYVPQLVRHLQLLYEAMRRAGTRAYIKVGTSGTGGMGFNIPYTHGEEKPSRLLLSKAAIAGAQSMLTFLMARTPDAPPIVKEIKPSAVIGWREIGFGPITGRGGALSLVDCPLAKAVAAGDPTSLAPTGDFGEHTGRPLEGVYIDTGENGLFSAGEFAAITALGQMELVTPEEIAENVVREIAGGNTGADIVAALDGAVMGPSYRGGVLREAALNLLRTLEEEHGEAVAFEILGPPRLSKLLFEGYLLKRVCGTLGETLGRDAGDLANAAQDLVIDDTSLRQRIISIGLPILLADGARLLRGPVLKAQDAAQGWVDLTAANMRHWQERLMEIRTSMQEHARGDTSSRQDRMFRASRSWDAARDDFDIGEIVAWIFMVEHDGRRGKA